jgi:hypothetical protein
MPSRPPLERVRPKVEITTPPGGVDHLVITRGDGKQCTTHEMRGGTQNERIVNIVSDLLNDRRIAEHLP